MVAVVRAFTEADEGEPSLRLLEYVDEEGFPVLLHHFSFAVDAKPKQCSSRSLSRGGLRPLYRILSFGVDHVHLRKKGISVDLHFFLFLVGKDELTLIKFFLNLLLKAKHSPVRWLQE